MITTTIAEIESAVEKLPSQDVDELASWLTEYQTTLRASAEVFQQYDDEEDGSLQVAEES